MIKIWKKLQRLYYIVSEIKLFYLFFFSLIRIEKNSKLEKGKDVSLWFNYIYIRNNSILSIQDHTSFSRSKIIVKNNSHFSLDINVSIKNADIEIEGKMSIGESTILNGTTKEKLRITVLNEGYIEIGKYNLIRNDRILVRFGGRLSIGNFTNINSGSEIRVDEFIRIGSYNQISYKCMIWDTNTHNMYSFDKRRKLTNDRFPNFGYEFEKPKTAPIEIGDDCWIGREVAILKGSKIRNKCVLGFRVVLIGEEIEENSTVVNSYSKKIIRNEI